MRVILFLCAAVAMWMPVQMAYAGDDADAADIVILSVKPRSPDVKPIPMSIPATGHEAGPAATASDKAKRVASADDANRGR